VAAITSLPDRLRAEPLARQLHPLDHPVGRLPLAGYRAEHVVRPRPAAVLVGILSGVRPAVLLTQRSRRLQHHAGQVAFPGGARDPADHSVVATALRETFEETAIEPARVTPLGYLGRYDTITGYRMTAVVGLIGDGPPPTPDGAEVDEVFSVSLEHVADERNYRTSRVIHDGRRFEILTLEHERFHIWGATAALLHHFSGVLRKLQA